MRLFLFESTQTERSENEQILLMDSSGPRDKSKDYQIIQPVFGQCFDVFTRRFTVIQWGYLSLTLDCKNTRFLVTLFLIPC